VTELGQQTRSRVGRFFGYPLVTILIGFILFIFVLQAIVFGNLARLFIAIVGAPMPGEQEKGLPADQETLAAYGYGYLVAAIIVVPVAVWVYRKVIVRWCEGRRDAVPELAFTRAARTWVVLGAALALLVIALVLIVAAVSGDLRTTTQDLLLPGLAYALGLSLFAGVVEELFARGIVFRISEQHVGSLLALIITAVIFGAQHADNPSATPVSIFAVALEGGVMLAAVFMLARTLWAVFAVHFVWNFGQSVLGMPVSGNQTIGAVKVNLSGSEALSGGSFGIEVSWLAIGAWTLVTVVLLVMVVRRRYWWSWRNARGAVQEGRGNALAEVPKA
jgi:uncharacterized protein